MTATFNLLDAPWLPVVWADNGREEDVGLRDALLHAHELRELRDDSPLVTAAAYRLIVAVVHRAYATGGRAAAPANREEWGAMWQRRAFNPAPLTAYLDRCHDGFDLFHPARPFYQSAALTDPDLEKSASNLVLELTTAGPTLFDHTTDGTTVAFTPAQAARALIARQAFAVGGRITFEKGQGEHGSADASPLFKGAVLLVQGNTLFETLMLNLHRYSRRDEEPFAGMEADDCPAWERDSETETGDRKIVGYLDLLTWQSRRIRLIPTTDGDGAITVRRVVIVKGEQFPGGQSERFGKETMLAFRIDPKTKTGDPNPALSFQPGKALWRDSMTLLQSKEGEGERPKMLEWLNDLVGEGYLDRRAVVPLAAYGLGSDQSKIFFWRTEQLPLPLACLDDEKLLYRVQQALELADKINGVLRQTARELARYFFVPDPPEDKKAREDAYRGRKDDIAAMVGALAPGRRYWPLLDTAFSRFLVAQADEATTAPPGESGAAFSAWGEAVRRAAYDDKEAMLAGFDRTARMLRATAQAQMTFDFWLWHHLKEFGAIREEATVGT